MDRIQIQALMGLSHAALELYVTRTENACRQFLTSTGWENVSAGNYVAPSYLMEREAAQELANALWNAGIRPEQSKQSQGAYDAQGQHLEDMRAIAFDKLKVERP